MSFSTDQIKDLGGKLSAKVVKTREVEGRALSYLEGWHVIAEANRIFGFDAWDRETISNTCIWEGMRRGCPSCGYIAKVRITVRAGPLTVIREGSGSGQGTAVSPAEAHEIALKAAETDATKRALATFGNPFGLALYDKEQAGVRKTPARPAPSRSNGSNAHGAQETAGGKPSTANGSNSSAAPQTDCRQGGNGVGEAVPVLQSGQGSATSALKEPSQPTDKSVLAIAEPRRVRKPEHLRYVASKPCLICGRKPCEAHHLTFAQPRGLSLKSSDEFTVPLCRAHHRQLHAAGDEEAWWREREVDALGTAANLWEHLATERS